MQFMPTNKIIRILNNPIDGMRHSCVVACDGFAYRGLLKPTFPSALLSSRALERQRSSIESCLKGLRKAPPHRRCLHPVIPAYLRNRTVR